MLNCDGHCDECLSEETCASFVDGTDYIDGSEDWEDLQEDDEDEIFND